MVEYENEPAYDTYHEACYKIHGYHRIMSSYEVKAKGIKLKPGQKKKYILHEVKPKEKWVRLKFMGKGKPMPYGVER